MDYDLTTLLTTIASASAGFAAILGGFIASKLIAINGERDSLLEKISDVEDEYTFKSNELKRLQDEEQRENAEYYILAHIEQLTCNMELSKFYDENEDSYIKYVDLKPYWDDALSFMERYSESSKSNQVKGAGGLKLSIEKDFEKNKFHKVLLDGINKYFDSFSSPFNAFSTTQIQYSLGNPIRDNIIQNLLFETKYLKVQKQQLAENKNKLRSPRGIKSGLVIFTLFILLDIVIPIILININIDTSFIYYFIMVISIVLLILGFSITLGYLIYMLRWKETKENNK